MTDGTNYLNYELYQQSGQAPNGACNYSAPTVWGTTGINSFLTDAATTKAARTYNVCGQVAGGQDVPSGTYNDIVEASVNF
jgi:spore coat protein U-like protein